MQKGIIEHVNMSVSDPKKTASLLSDLFGWSIRWEGDSKDDGYTVHVGRDDCYLALYKHPNELHVGSSTYTTRGGLNHIGIVVDDLDETEQRVLAANIETHNHGDYDPGRRFYFYDHDNIEFEVVQY